MNRTITLPASDDLDEVPPLTEEDFRNAVFRVGLNPVTKEAFQRAARQMGLKPVGKKTKINITLDPDVVAWYKAQAGGRGYQTLMNAALREAMRGHQIAETLRQVIREELRPA